VTPAALSTMWMQHCFDQVRPFSDAARCLGLSSIELSHYFTPAMVAGLRPGQVPVSSVHFHDCVGLRDHLVPPTGEMDFGAVVMQFPAKAVRVCEFDWFFGEEELTEGHLHLQRAALLKSTFD